MTNAATPLIGNPRALAAVARALAGPSPPHAWLFVGPEGVGKATLACRLAQALNCQANFHPNGAVGATHSQDALTAAEAPENGETVDAAGEPHASPLRTQIAGGLAEPCGVCAQCDRIARHIHADVSTVAIEPTTDGPQHKDIGVDQLREVERAVALNPFEGRTRVVIIDPADAMSEEAQNAFLKTLEEPPPHAVFVLITDREERLLPTIHSRCRRIEFGLVPAAAIEQALLKEGAAPAPARLIARISGGRPGIALQLAREPSRLESRRQALDQARSLAIMSMAERMGLSERLSDQFRRDRAPVYERLGSWLVWWRDILLVQSGAEDAVTAADMLEYLRADAIGHARDDVLAFIQALLACRSYLQDNVQSRIALDALMLAAPCAKSGIKDVAARRSLHGGG